MTTDQTIEQEIQAKGLTAPRVTPDDIEANIVSEVFFTAGDGAIGKGAAAFGDLKTSYQVELDLLTFCVLILRNGFTVTGESACASPENFDAELGRKIARANAVQKIWPLMGYELKQRLHQSANPDQSPDSPEKKNYTLNDIEAYATAFMERMHQYEFRIRTKDGLKYEGFIQKGTALEMKINALEECNRQRNNA